MRNETTEPRENTEGAATLGRWRGNVALAAWASVARQFADTGDPNARGHPLNDEGWDGIAESSPGLAQTAEGAVT